MHSVLIMQLGVDYDLNILSKRVALNNNSLCYIAGNISMHIRTVARCTLFYRFKLTADTLHSTTY